MSETPDPLRILDDMITEAVAVGVGHHTAQDERLGGRTIRLEGCDLINFASCSYLGLELDPRVIAGVVDAVTRYGSQFSSSRVFVSAPMYEELEEQLASLFGGDALAAPSTTLGHLAALPVLVSSRDAVLLDHHVHNSIQMASNLLSTAGARVEFVRHHDLEHLEERILALSKKHSQIWFLVDGVCSMFGDLAPIRDFHALLDRHENLRLYVDDAHGMSWCGKNGSGYALSEAPLHPQMVLATSLNKAFGAAGGALVFSDPELRRRVRTCGATLLFSGPIQPPMLGAAVASARLHLDKDFELLQQRYAEHTQRCHEMLAATGLPTPSDPRSPVQFVEVGLPQKAQRIVKGLMDDGYFTNVAQFPAVPMKRAGVRFTLTLHQREEDLRGLIDSLARHHEVASQAPSTRTPAVKSAPSSRISTPVARLQLERHASIRDIPAQEWNRMLGDRGSFSADALTLLERVFHAHPDPEIRWRFHYYRILDPAGKTLLATFFTQALWKADMLESAAVSRSVERQREHDPLHLTMQVFSMGSLLTEGDHLYLDPSLGRPGSPASQPLLSTLLAAVQKDAEEAGCNTIALRDLEDPDPHLETFLRAEGFIAMQAPESFELALDWSDDEAFRKKLSPRARKHQRVSVAPFDDSYRVEIYSRSERAPTDRELERFYELYCNVKAKSLELNTFPVPRRLFDLAARDERWEFVALFPSDAALDHLPVGMALNYVGDRHYVPLIVGLDYDYVETGGLYRQCLRQVIARARKLELERLCLGMGASLEKRRFGAHAISRHLYLQTEDHYVYDALARIAIDHVGGDGN